MLIKKQIKICLKFQKVGTLLAIYYKRKGGCGNGHT